MKILVLNSGSSSEKACLYDIREAVPDRPPTPLWEGKIKWISNCAIMAVKNSLGVKCKEQLAVSAHAEGIRHLLRTTHHGKARGIASLSEIDVVGRRVVHGGPRFETPVLITDEVRAIIASMSAFPPPHITAELQCMEIVENLRCAVPQTAVFDTAFHRQIPMERNRFHC